MKLYTIGYEGIDFSQFLSELKWMNVGVVFDIRRNTSSRKKGFSKGFLEECLPKNGIGYIGLRELGTPIELRDNLKRTRDYVEFFKAYQDIIRHKTQELGVICQHLKEENVLLLCYERDHEKCHRKIVAEEVIKLDNNGTKLVPLSI